MLLRKYISRNSNKHIEDKCTEIDCQIYMNHKLDFKKFILMKPYLIAISTIKI